MTTDKDDYVLGELIGEGAYGAVFVCFDRKYEEKVRFPGRCCPTDRNQSFKMIPKNTFF